MSQPRGELLRRLDDLESRLERLWSEPESLRRQTSWLQRVWLNLKGSKNEIVTVALGAFRASPEASFAARWKAHRDAVIDEIEVNIARMERTARVEGQVAAPILTWLFGVHRWVSSMERAHTAPAPQSRLALTRGLASRALLPMAQQDRPAEIVVLAGVDGLLNEAAQEVERVARRRRLLEAARRVLLDAEATVLGGEAWSERRRLIAEELTQLRRIEAAGVNANVDLSHQLRRGLERRRTRDVARACAALSYLGADARRGSRAASSTVAAVAARVPSAAPSSKGLMPERVEGSVQRAYRRAREENARALAGAMLSETLALRRRRRHLRAGAHLSLIRMALGVDGVFDVGGGLERERLDTVSPSLRLVPFPTPELALREVDEPKDVGRAIIEDPRLLLYHLASRRLLQRRFVHRSEERRRQDGVRAAVRFYLLDGSSSMHGARARMRDAILVAELATLVSRLERPTGRIRSLLFYRYFNSSAEVTQRVTAVAEALQAIEDVLGAGRSGGTDIEHALVDSLELIESQRDDDIDLSRAQVVLVTDGEAPFDPELITAAQAQLGIPVRVSVIALGGENTALRAYAATQRREGLRVLYHHVGDDELERWEAGWDEEAWPSFDMQKAPPAAFEGMIEDVAALHESVAMSPEDPEMLLSAMREVGLDAGDLEEGTRAKLELSRRDTRSLGRRFDRLFPKPDSVTASLIDPADQELIVVLDALGVVLEVLALSATDAHTAKADAIAILERLLRERGLPPGRYLALAEEYPDAVGGAIAAVREVCGVGG